MVISSRTLTLDEFMQRYSDDGPFEFVDGAFIPMTPQATGSARIAGELFFRLSGHVREHQLGEVFIEAPFVLTLDKSHWVQGARVPDVMFYRSERFAQFVAAYPDWQSLPVVLVPDFVAKIISPTDRFSEVNRKVAQYLADGVQLIWVIDPQQQTAQVYTAGSNQHTTLSGDPLLDAGEVIPGFSVQLAQLFGS